MKVFSVLLLAVTLTFSFVDGAGHDCESDHDACTQELRRLMLSEYDYWFGQDYHDKCVQGGQEKEDSTCLNPQLGKSVLARFLNTTDSPDSSTVSALELVDVVYSASGGKYYGCDHYTEVDPVYNHHIDPTHMTELNSWSLMEAPEVRWERPANAPGDALYTVVIWDVGYFYLHGFYINCFDTMTSGQMIIPYNSPKNPSPTGNLYAFIVIAQSGSIDQKTTQDTIGKILYLDEYRFRPMALLTMMPGLWTTPIAANLLSIRGDTYAVQYQKDTYAVNYCPLHASQQTAFYDIMKEAGVELEWSYDPMAGNPKSQLYAETAPFLFLPVDITIEFDAPELTIESCCSWKTFTKTLYRTNPFDQSTASPAATRNTPRVHLSPVMIFDMTQHPKDRMYTLVMLDMGDALYKVENKVYNLHWFVTNIRNADISTGNEIKSYLGPNPLDRYKPRPYIFLLLEQKEEIHSINLYDYNAQFCLPIIDGRCISKLVEMLKDLNGEVVAISWMLALQDELTRKRIYEDFLPGPMVNMCDGIEGFEDPCPVWQIVRSNGSGQIVPSLALMAVALVTFVTKLF